MNQRWEVFVKLPYNTLDSTTCLLDLRESILDLIVRQKNKIKVSEMIKVVMKVNMEFGISQYFFTLYLAFMQ